MDTYHFANILFSGPCNLRCPDCIGKRMEEKRLPANLKRFPLYGIDAFIQRLNRFGIRQVSLTGSNTEPQLYAHETRLIETLRENVPSVKISLHTNGTVALTKMDVFNRYDRATISFPSFDPKTYNQMTGSNRIVDLEQILQKARIPIKISTLISDANLHEIPSIIDRCKMLGITRLVLRKRYGDTAEYDFFPGLRPERFFGNNPVFKIDGMEITVWDFSSTRLRCLNLFSDGTITDRYSIAEDNK